MGNAIVISMAVAIGGGKCSIGATICIQSLLTDRSVRRCSSLATTLDIILDKIAEDIRRTASSLTGPPVRTPDRVAARNRLHPKEPHHPQPMQMKLPREASFQHHGLQRGHEAGV
ncbi:hypothetical protein [Paraburkholderia sp. SG-MS1]|uniref:hypothetical protein n=1 Tax=Paraburkholderia sp. SG-MS1 TaxID=2023741 RepID=UPI001EEAA68B|nr:hypothetical protein [Paraburkholderia sp. SG-MS1]